MFEGTEGDVNIGAKDGTQFFAAATTTIYTIFATWVALKLTAAMVGGLRVTEEDETQGLDLSLHEETGYRY